MTTYCGRISESEDRQIQNTTSQRTMESHHFAAMLRPTMNVYITGPCLVTAFTTSADELPRDWTGNYPPCTKSQELFKEDQTWRPILDGPGFSCRVGDELLGTRPRYGVIHTEQSELCVAYLGWRQSSLPVREAARSQVQTAPPQDLIAFNPIAVLPVGDQI